MSGKRHTIGSGLDHTVNGAADKRRVCRYRVVLQDALLGWWEDAKFVNTPAQLINLSTSGCQIELPRTPKPAKGEPAWICPLGLSPAQWIEGTVVSVRKPLLKKCRMGFLFRTHVTFESFKTLIYGSGDVFDSMPDEAPDHERDHFWK
jgi:PilZ domain